MFKRFLCTLGAAPTNVGTQLGSVTSGSLVLNVSLANDAIVSTLISPVTGVYIMNFHMIFYGSATGTVYSSSGGLYCPFILYSPASGLYQSSGTCIITLAASTNVTFKMSYSTGSLTLSSGFSTLTRIA